MLIMQVWCALQFDATYFALQDTDADVPIHHRLPCSSAQIALGHLSQSVSLSAVLHLMMWACSALCTAKWFKSHTARIKREGNQRVSVYMALVVKLGCCGLVSTL